MKNLAKETIKTAMKDMVKELNLNQYPKVVFETTDEGYVMAAGGITEYCTRNFFDRVITRTECDYVLHINKKAVNHMITTYSIAFGNKQASYDCLYLLICHELRHMWQYQEQFQVGDKFNDLSASLDELTSGHGASKVEKDANEWMIAVAKRKGIEELAYYMEMEQRSMGLINQLDTEFKKDMYENHRKALKKYNRVLYWLLK